MYEIIISYDYNHITISITIWNLTWVPWNSCVGRPNVWALWTADGLKARLKAFEGQTARISNEDSPVEKCGSQFSMNFAFRTHVIRIIRSSKSLAWRLVELDALKRPNGPFLEHLAVSNSQCVYKSKILIAVSESFVFHPSDCRFICEFPITILPNHVH